VFIMGSVCTKCRDLVGRSFFDRHYKQMCAKCWMRKHEENLED